MSKTTKDKKGETVETQKIPVEERANFHIKKTLFPGEIITRAHNMSYEIYCHQTSDGEYCEITSSDDSLQYQIYRESNQLWVDYNTGVSERSFTAVYRTTHEGWKFIAGTKGAALDERGLAELWPIPEPPSFFADSMDDIAPIHGKTITLPLPPPSQSHSIRPTSELEREFEKDFAGWVKSHANKMRVVVGGWTGNFLYCLTVGHLGLGCEGWAQAMYIWLNGASWIGKGIRWEAVRRGHWPFVHHCVRITFPDGHSIILDPWYDSDNPFWEENEYTKEFGDLKPEE